MMKRYLTAIALAGGVATLSGCAGLGGAAGETAMFALETPTLEAAANRGAVGAALLRVNHQVLNNMPISSDAEWPRKMVSDMTEEQKKLVNRVLENDPWYATRFMTDANLKANLGGYIPPGMTPLTYSAYKKINVLYGNDPANWPDMMRYSSNLGKFLEFADAEKGKKPVPVEAASGSQYPNLFAALVALMPANFQKDLETSGSELQQAIQGVALLKRDEADLKKRLEEDKAANRKDYKGDLKPLTADETAQIKEQLDVLAVQIKEAEEIESQKEGINFQVLDSAVEALKSDINLSEENVALAKNLKAALDSVQEGATHAGTLYFLATTAILARGALENFDKELAVLSRSRAYSQQQQDMMAERMARLVYNALYLAPSIGMGTYYAVKQNSLAGKYAQAVTVVLEADAAQKKQQEKEQAAKQVAAN